MKKFVIPPEQLSKNIEHVRYMTDRGLRIDGMPAHMSWEECRAQNASLKKQLEALQILLEDERVQHRAEIGKLRDILACLVEFIGRTNPTIVKELNKKQKG